MDEKPDTSDEDEGSSSPEVEAAADITFEEFAAAKVILRRNKLAHWVHEPFFAAAVTGCYVRYGIGPDPITKKACYRMCKIVEVEKVRRAVRVFEESKKWSRWLCRAVSTPLLTFPLPSSQSASAYLIPHSLHSKQIKTNLRLVLEFGSDRKSFKIAGVSNDPVEMQDFAVWRNR